ncbi:MAG: uroporphyrinogen III synthase [Rhodospirillaceae bacterium]|jgi:uroporphyrinogen-III synthase|nr:uroporphyrinogen III synthase [Rhodospirillaceae bacterium]|tara:strand:- start:4915 stop:5619 length:705 start_codon:yes stop_codon:yes gene_type:complete
MRLLITRPREDAEPLAALLRQRGIETALEPLMSIVDSCTPDPGLSGVQALLITSANGIRAFARRVAERGIAVCAVGDASARAAGDLGFGDVASASGDVEALAAMVKADRDPNAGALLHVAGTDVAGDLSGLLEAAGFEVRRAFLYEARAAGALSAETRDAMEAGTLDGVLLFSPRTAALFAELATGAGLSESCRDLIAYCLSPAVAEKARALAWRDVVVAAEPNQEALLRALGI